MSRHTGAAPQVVRGIRERDGGCVVCGTDWSPTTQHRVARGMGGTRDLWVNLPSNLITLCGSGTTGHHGWVEAHPIFAREAGWSVPRHIDPRTVPVLYPTGWFLLSDDYTLLPDPDPGRHASCSPRGWGEAVDGEDVGRPWPAHTAGEGGAEDALRPWRSPVSQ